MDLAAPGEPGPYDRISRTERARLIQALELKADGWLEPARALLRELCIASPDNILLGRWLQEVELESAPHDAEARAEFEAEVRKRYRALAEDRETAAAQVLAARVEPDAPSALLLLDRALKLDPACAWAWYGKAHVNATSGSLSAAMVNVREALRLDAGHLPALRLEASLLGRNGQTEAAIRILEHWLKFAEEDLRFEEATIQSARLELALLLLQDEQAEAAEELLLEIGELTGQTQAEVRRQSVLAAAYQALDKPLEAVGAADCASKLDPEVLLPAVQLALLTEYSSEDHGLALELWERVITLAESGGNDLYSFLQVARARVHRGRLERELEGAQKP